MKKSTGKKLIPIHPGEILREEFLMPMKITQYRLAHDLDVPRPRISQIIRGERGITADTALRLARYFGTSSEFWMNLQMRYEIRTEEREKGRYISKRVPIYHQKAHKIKSS